MIQLKNIWAIYGNSTGFGASSNGDLFMDDEMTIFELDSSGGINECFDIDNFIGFFSSKTEPTSTEMESFIKNMKQGENNAAI